MKKKFHLSAHKKKMTSLFSKAKNRVANWMGKGSTTATNDNDASSPQQQTSVTSPKSKSNNNNNVSSSSAVFSPSKLAELDKILMGTNSVVDLTALRNICWCGIPDASKRYDAWCLMLRYMPNQLSMVQSVFTRKRNEYAMYVQNHHKNVAWDELLASQSVHGNGVNVMMMMMNNNNNNNNSNNSNNGNSNFFDGNNNINTGNGNSSGASRDASQEDLSIMRQIRKDVPRTFNGVHMLQFPRCQLLLERVLFIWAIRHPASGYVQGMNDILLPFIFVVLSKKISSDGDVYRLLQLSETTVKAVSGSLNENDWMEVEADCYWLLSAFMSSVQSNFTFSQGGTHAFVQKLDKIVAVADPPLHTFLKESGVSFEEFAFRWMNCFLLRELPPALGVRLFDTYCAEEVTSTTTLGFVANAMMMLNNNNSSNHGNNDHDGGNGSNSSGNSGSSSVSQKHQLSGFGAFHVYVCAALLIRWSEKIRSCDDFALIVKIVQNPSDESFNEETISELTAQAYVLHQQYGSRIG